MRAAASGSVAPSSQISGGGIGEELDIRNALPQFVDDGASPADERETVGRRLNPLRIAIEETNAENGLHIGDRFGDRRLRYGEASAGFGNPALFHDGQQDIQVAQLEPAKDAIIPFHGAACDMVMAI